MVNLPLKVIVIKVVDAQHSELKGGKMGVNLAYSNVPNNFVYILFEQPECPGLRVASLYRSTPAHQTKRMEHTSAVQQPHSDPSVISFAVGESSLVWKGLTMTLYLRF